MIKDNFDESDTIVGLALVSNLAFAEPAKKYDLLSDSCINPDNAIETQIELENENYFTYLTKAEVDSKEFTRVIVDLNSSEEEVKNIGDNLVNKGLIKEYTPIEDNKDANLEEILEKKRYITKKSPETNQKIKDVLILYTENFQNNASFTCLERAELFSDLIDSHWDINSHIKLVNDYNRGEINNFDVLMHIGENYLTDIPYSLIQDVNNTSKEIVWINYLPWGLDTKKLGFKVSGTHSLDFDKISYKGYDFKLNPTDTSLVDIIDPEKSKVLAWLVDNETGKENDNFLYVSYLPLAIPYLDEPIPFFNSLHEAFGHHQKNAKALLRLEGIHPGLQNSDLLSIDEFLEQKNIPYHFGVIPVYVNPKENINISILDKPQLIKTLKTMSNNGNLVLNGYTHQYDGETVIDFEFWDESKNQPIEEDSKEFAQSRIINALTLLKEAGLYTDIWETPNYTASNTDYKTFEKIFPIIYDSRNGINVPFAFKRNNTVFSPIDLGYVSSPESVDKLIANAKKIYDCFEDPSISFFYHPYLFTNKEVGKGTLNKIITLFTNQEPEKGTLNKIIDSLRDIGYEFSSIYNLVEKEPSFEEKIISAKKSFQKGICLSAYSKDKYFSYEINNELNQLDEIGTEWIQIQAMLYQNNVNSSFIFADEERTASDESLEYIINKLHKRGFKVFFEPVVNLEYRKGGDWMGMIKPDDWDKWFQSYQDTILHYAKLAQKNEIEEFSVGVEFNSAEKFKEDWQDILSEVRENYKGIITYAANFDHYKQVPFWDDVDLVSMNFYFSVNPRKNPFENWKNITDYHEPTREELVDNWQVHVKDIDNFQKEINKPILISEVGYASKTGCSFKPWSWYLGEYNTKEQADCYWALHQVWKDKPYISGIYFFGWPIGDVDINGAMFNPKNNPAEKIIEKWFHELKNQEEGE